MQQFMWGALTMSALAAGLFFLRFYRDSRERLFAIFAAAFVVLAVHWVLLATMVDANEHRPLIYAVRAFAYALILAAVLDKNRHSR